MGKEVLAKLGFISKYVSIAGYEFGHKRCRWEM